MRKHSYFASRFREGWPGVAEMEPYFLAPPGKRWFFETRNDSAGLTLEGVDGTGHFGPVDRRRIAIHLDMWGHPELGVQLTYRKRGGGHDETFYSMGDPSRLDEHVPSLHDTLLPVGLFISYEDGWEAVKEFIATDGERPKSTTWIEEEALPAGTFPAP